MESKEVCYHQQHENGLIQLAIAFRSHDTRALRQESHSVAQAGVQWHNRSSLQLQPPGLTKSSYLSLLKMWSPYVAQADLELLSSSDPATLTFQTPGELLVEINLKGSSECGSSPEHFSTNPACWSRTMARPRTPPDDAELKEVQPSSEQSNYSSNRLEEEEPAFGQ
ncbi:UPF0764 protein C16orf89 [Plecturocebus cupreus]